MSASFCFALLCREDTSYKPVKLISQINHSKYCFALLSRNYEVNSSSREAGGTSCHPYRTAVNNKPIRQSGVSLLCCDLRLSSKRYYCIRHCWRSVILYLWSTLLFKFIFPPAYCSWSGNWIRKWFDCRFHQENLSANCLIVDQRLIFSVPPFFLLCMPAVWASRLIGIFVVQ